MNMGQNYMFDRVTFLTPEIGWITGSRKFGLGMAGDGIALSTPNGGSSWRMQYKISRQTLVPFFITPKEGWLAAYPPESDQRKFKILHTVTGGESWNNVY